MAFVEAINSIETKAGVKGSDVYTEEGVGDNRVALFQMLVRGLEQREIRKYIRSAPEEHKEDFVVMAFQTRDVRGGKGEKDLFYAMLDGIFVRWPELVEPVVNLIPEYGSWKDLVKLLTYDFVDKTVTTQVIRATAKLVKEQFEKDKEAPHPSLLAKWLPREDSKMKLQAKYFAGILFPDIPEGERAGQSPGRSALEASPRADDRFAAYRKAVSTINKKLKTTEINMCGGKWAELEPGKIPGRCMLKNRKAFLYQNKKAEEEPSNEDRIACRNKFLEHITGGKKVHAAGTVYPHEITLRMRYFHSMSEDEEKLLESQWATIREEAGAAGGLRKVVPMCDFSGSMGGIPMDVSLALGILISEINNEAFKDYILTFDSTPKWVSFKDCKSLKEKINEAISHGLGLSTDFQKACDLILQRLVKCKVPVEDAPDDLLVFTDMGFDAACGYSSSSYYTGNSYSHVTKDKPWQTHCQMIRESFEKHGYKMPRIVIWNLRAEYKDFHAKADEEGVVLLSGWSPSVLKAIQGNGIQNQTPYQALRHLLDNERYDAVRAIFSKKSDGEVAATGGAGKDDVTESKEVSTS